METLARHCPQFFEWKRPRFGFGGFGIRWLQQAHFQELLRQRALRYSHLAAGRQDTSKLEYAAMHHKQHVHTCATYATYATYATCGKIDQNPPTPLWRWRRAYWGAISNTKCSMTFVNIAVAISALAGGGQKRFRTETKFWHRVHILVVFSNFFDDFWMSELPNAWKWNFGSFWVILVKFWRIFGHFGRLPSGHGKTTKSEKNIATSATLKRVWMPEHLKQEKHAKTSVLYWLLWRQNV